MEYNERLELVNGTGLTRKDVLLQLIDDIIADPLSNYLVLKLSNQRHPAPEIIVNNKINLTYKREFYAKFYTEDLRHIGDSGIRIEEGYGAMNYEIW